MSVVADSFCREHGLLPCECDGAVRAKKKNKFGAIKTEVDGIKFDSRKEARRYTTLKRLAGDNVIQALEIHPKFDLIALGGKLIGVYEADFSYIVNDSVIVEDVKGINKSKTWRKGQRYGTISDLAKWKMKHFEIQYGIKVRIV